MKIKKENHKKIMLNSKNWSINFSKLEKKPIRGHKII